ncbi:MAG: sugar ABC transporter permease [Ancalomicrobiaceae bacterium]|nr:sugar ABC transporter permease [Ancalomicrobiaceae bacterium]
MPDAAAIVRPRSARPSRRPRGRQLSVMLLTAPALAWFAAFMVGPLVALFYFSLLDWPSLLAPSRFIGLGNFARMIDDPLIHQAAFNSALQVGIVVPTMLVISFMLGYYLSLMPPGHKVMRAALFTPVLLSASAQAMVFVGVFSPMGLVNATLRWLGLGMFVTPWLSSGGTAMACIIAVGIWSAVSLSTLMFATRIANISPEVMEASELDGCGHWSKMWRIAAPISWEFAGVVGMLQFLWVLFGSATLVLLLTRGGPGNSTATLAFLVYDVSFNRDQVGYGQAVAVVLFIVGVAGMIGIRTLFRART